MPVTTFNTAQLNAGLVRFVHDGSEDAPTFSLQADDGAASNALSALVAGSVSFSPLNDAPVAATAGNTASGNEDSSITGSVPAGFDVDDASGLTYAMASAPNAAQGALSFNSDGTFSFAPAANFNGAASFSYRVVDPHGAQSGPQNFTIAIDPINDVPQVIAASGDSAGADLEETDSKLLGQGTLTLADPDQTDPVTISVTGVTHTGPTGGLSDATLLSYFTVPTTPVLTASQSSAHFAWNFDSLGQAFDFLAAGETLSLHYTIRPDDAPPQTGTGDGVVTLNIAGTNDSPVIDAATLAAVEEDTSNPAGQTVGALFAGKFHDADARSISRASPSSATTRARRKACGNTCRSRAAFWEAVGTVSDLDALAFDLTTKLRFVPAQDFNGIPGSLDVRGLDDTYDEDFTIGAGGGRYTINTTVSGTEPLGHGGTTPISDLAVTLGTSVTAVNDAPLATGETLGGDIGGFTYNAANGHWYAINAHAVNWAQARSEALAAGGYLATITSSGENNFVSTLLNNYVTAHNMQNAYAYIGGSDIGTEGSWLWIDGPEANRQFWQGGTAGSATGGAYENWQRQVANNLALVEPNGSSSENYTYIRGSGEWADFSGNAEPELLSDRTQLRRGQRLDHSGSFLLANDTDLDSAGLSINGLGTGNGTTAATAHGGTVELLGNGDIRYTPAANYNGADSFSYTVKDAGGAVSNAATVTFEVAAAPVVTAAVPDNHVLNSTDGYVPGRAADQGLQLTNLGIAGDTDVTVEFWANFGDDVSQIPVGFYLYDLYFADFGGGIGRAIGFNTGNADVRGVARSDLIGQWHHYAAVFHNGDATQSKLYIDGELQTLTQLAGSPLNSSAVITDDLRIGGWDYDSIYSMDGQIDNVSIWHGARTRFQISADMNGSVTGPQSGLVAAYRLKTSPMGPAASPTVRATGIMARS